MIHFHKWTAWSDPVDVYDINMKNQFRKCTVCNAVSVRSFNHRINVTAAKIIAVLSDKGEE